jgi:hypothetical protein
MAIGQSVASTHASALTIMGTKEFWNSGGWMENFFEQEPARVWQETGASEG